MKISVIIPAYNEAATIQEILKRVREAPPKDKQIIVVDDGSTDGTSQILKNIEEKEAAQTSSSQHESIKIIYQPKNYGKGSAIKAALPFVQGEIIIIQDADLEYDPKDYPELIKPIEEGKAEVVYGSRILADRLWKKEKNKLRIPYFRYYIGGRFLSFLTSILYRAKITDESTGYKVFKKEVLMNLNLKCKGFEFCPEVTAKVLKKGYKIYEVPIHYTPRLIEEGKKIRWYDGLIAIWMLIKHRFFLK
jgi:glycosyltransferase involved in cell wall biosynthesis